MDIEAIGKDIVHCAIKVHSTLGPGLLESAYQKCLSYEQQVNSTGQKFNLVNCHGHEFHGAPHGGIFDPE